MKNEYTWNKYECINSQLDVNFVHSVIRHSSETNELLPNVGEDCMFLDE